MDEKVSDVLTKYILSMSEHQRMDFDQFSIDNGTLMRTPAPTTDPFPDRDDSWSIIWYIASFSGLIAFFLIVSCSEWCCRLHVRGPNAGAGANGSHTTGTRTSATSADSQAVNLSVQVDVPPPNYELFAPPTYDSVYKPDGGGIANPACSEKSEYDVYVVPVHAIHSLQHDPCKDDAVHPSSHNTRVDEPPSYISVQMNAQSSS